MSGSKVSKGDKVLVQVNPAQNNGDSEAVATVVKVMDDGDGNQLVNVKAHCDGDVDLLMRNVPVLTASAAKKDDAPQKRAVRA